MACDERAWRLSARGRKVTLTVHVIASVALIGSAASILLLALIAAASDGPPQADVLYAAVRLLLYALVLPLSLAALVTGLVLGMGTHWGLLRHRWVTVKLGLLLASALVGIVVMRGATEWVLAGGAVLNILFAATSSTLSVFKPGSRARRTRARERVAARGPSIEQRRARVRGGVQLRA